MTEYFEATAESYFKHLTRDGVEAAVAENKGPDFANGISRIKKAEAAAYAEAQAMATAWLPSPLRAAIAVTGDGHSRSTQWRQSGILVNVHSERSRNTEVW